MPENKNTKDILSFEFLFISLADLDDPYSTLSKQKSIDMDEGRMTPKATSGMLIVLYMI